MFDKLEDNIEDMMETMKYNDSNLTTIENLPNEMLTNIFDKLNCEDLLNICEVSQKWFEIINDKLLRNDNCLLIKDKCNDVKIATDKIIKEIILINVNDFGYKDNYQHKCSNTISNYLNKNETDLSTQDKDNHNGTNGVVLDNIDSLYVRYTQNTNELFLTLLKEPVWNISHLTLKIHNNIAIHELESILINLKSLQNICLIFDNIDDQSKVDLINYFNDCYHFYNEIIIQSIHPINEIIYICSNQNKLNKYVENNFEIITLNNINEKLVENVFKNNRELKRIIYNGNDINIIPNDNILDTISKTHVRIEHISLNHVNSSKETWNTFFTNINSNENLKRLEIKKCSNLTNEDILNLNNLKLEHFNIDMEHCTKTSNFEQLLSYCLHNVLNLKIKFSYNDIYLKNIIELFTLIPVGNVMKCLNIEIQRINNCSIDVSKDLHEFKSTLNELCKQSAIHVNVSEIYTKIQ